jgi:hypothetical protein
MRFDRHGQYWRPAHDREVQLRSSLGLVLGLILMVVSAGALLIAPGKDARPRPVVAAALP